MISGRPWPSHQRAASSSGRLWCARYVGEQPLFEQTGRSPMRLQMGGVDHQPVGFARLARKLGKNLVEHAKPAPPHEPVVDRLVRPVVARCITPAQTVADHKNNPADHPPVIYLALRATAENMARSAASAPARAKSNPP